MAGLIGQIRRLNNLGYQPFAEPFAGGAGAALTLLYLEETPEIYINDADTAIHDFWWSITKYPAEFAEMLCNARVDIMEWRRQRELYRDTGSISRLQRGFAAFYLNRCNRSGIIMNGGPIGGVSQSGKWKLDARFNKAALRRRFEKVAEYRERIHVSPKDGIRFISDKISDSAFYFIDPPYYNKGKMLYLNKLDDNYHKGLANTLRSTESSGWVLTYDDCPEIRRLYEDWATIRAFSLRYAAARRRSGKEILIVPKWMRLPTSQTSAAIIW